MYPASLHTYSARGKQRRDGDPIGDIISRQAADAFYAEAEYEKAVALYTSLIKSVPKDASVYLELASLYKETAQYPLSIRYCKKYLSFDSNEKAKLLLAEVLYLNGEPHEALRVLLPLSESQSAGWRVYVYTGLVYEDLENYDRAQYYFNKSLSLKENTIALSRLGKMFLKENDFKRAAGYFNRLVSLDGSVRSAYYHLGSALLNEGEFPEAYRNLSRACAFYPKAMYLKEMHLAAKKELGDDYFVTRQKEILKNRKAVTLPRYTPLSGDIPSIRVGIAPSVGKLTLKSQGIMTVTARNTSVQLSPNQFFTFILNGNSVYVRDYETKEKLYEFEGLLKIQTDNYPFYVLGIRYGKKEFWQRHIDIILRGRLEIITRGDSLTLVNLLTIEEYLYGVLPSEIYPSESEEALKAQAVAARTIAFRNMGRHRVGGYDFCSDVHCQVYKGMGKENPRTTTAVDSTRGEILFSGDTPIEAFYHANCGGCLRSDLFNAEEYLPHKLDRMNEARPFVSPWESRLWFTEPVDVFSGRTPRESNFRWQRIYDSEDFALAFGFPLRSLRSLRVIKKGDCQHIDRLQLVTASDATMITGDLKIRRFFDGLRSSACTIALKYTVTKGERIPSMLIIEGAGFGHGAGMSQEGMSRMAKEGFTYHDILNHYYKNIEIKKVY